MGVAKILGRNPVSKDCDWEGVSVGLVTDLLVVVVFALLSCDPCSSKSNVSQSEVVATHFARG